MQPDTLFMQTVRAKLVTALAGLVEPAAIRVGTIRPEVFPAVVLGLPSVEINGRASGGQTVAGRELLLRVGGALGEFVGHGCTDSRGAHGTTDGSQDVRPRSGTE